MLFSSASPDPPRRARLGALLVSVLLVAGALPVHAAPAPTTTVRRFALVVGANNGGSGRVTLKYAHSDARQMARVLTQIGGVAKADLVLLLNPNRITFLGGLYQMRSKLKAGRRAGQRVELVFYYSGHSDERGLLLHGQRFTYREIRTAVTDFPADVRIAVLDSCASGVLTRMKGGHRRPPFLVDKASDVRGRVFMTSASANEGAQESDRIRGSVFTHYLLSGMRGAADGNRDGKVTLNEAYRYAYHQTLKRTQGTRAGPMHASYDMQLQGSGDLVLTDLRGSSARLVLAAAMAGRVYIRDRKGRLVAEVAKRPGHTMAIGLGGGRYSVALQVGKTTYKARVRILRNHRLTLKQAQMVVASASEAVVLKGSIPPPQPLPPGAPDAKAPHDKSPSEIVLGKKHTFRPVSVALLPFLSMNQGADGSVVNFFSFSFLCDKGNHLIGVEMSLGCAIRTGNVYGFQMSVVTNHVLGEMWGVQYASGYNAVYQEFRGLQISAGGNYAGRLKGLQVGGAFAYARGPSYGLQVAGGANVAGSFGGLQAGSVNLTLGRHYGLQAGAVNVTLGKFAGLQASAVNVITGKTYGLQAGAVNVATGDYNGAQVGAVNTIAGRAVGAQVGAVNYAGRAKGLQIGAINVVHTDEGVVPIGPINVAANGIFMPTLWSDGISAVNLGFKLGTRSVYSLVGFGAMPGDSRDELLTAGSSTQKARRLSVIAGLGGHIETGVRWLYVDIDYLMHRLVRDYDHWASADYNNQLRVMVGFRLWRALSIYAGPTLNVAVSTEERELSGAAVSLFSKDRGDAVDPLYVHGSLGFVVGLSLEPHWGRLNANRR